MIPIPQQPRITILVKEGQGIVKIATNIDPEIKVLITDNQTEFDAEAKGEPFVYTI